MTGALWDDRTTWNGYVAYGDDTPGSRLNWIRWRLACELTARWYASVGVAVLPSVFVPMDGDLYSLAVASPDCRVSARYFGRLSRGAVRIRSDDVFLAAELGCVWSGIGTPGDHLQSVDIPWPRYVEEVAALLGLGEAAGDGHGHCWHAQAEARYPLVYETAVLLRTEGRQDCGVGQIGPFISARDEPIAGWLAAAGYRPSADEPDRWIRVQSALGELALGPRGTVVTARGYYQPRPDETAADLAAATRNLLTSSAPTRGSSTTPVMTPVMTPAQLAAARRTKFRDGAKQLAEAAGLPTEPYTCPGFPLSSALVFFADATTLAVLVGGEEDALTVDSALAYGIAHAPGRELAVVLPAGAEAATVCRAAHLDRPVAVWTHDGTAVTRVPPAERADVPAEMRETKLRGGEHDLGTRGGWIEHLISWADRHPDLVPAHRGSYRAWHCAGRQLLNVRRSRTGLALVAGVNYSKPEAGEVPPLGLALDGPLDAATAARIRAAVETGVADRLGDQDSGHAEHRLQAALASNWNRISWPVARRLEREMPARRPGGRTGYVDFVSVDDTGLLHIVETKIGGDEFLVLQGLDYWLWAKANADLLAAHFGLERLTGIRIDLVAAEPDGTTPDANTPILSPYAPAQLEALGSHIDWEVHRLAGWGAAAPSLQSLGLRHVPGQPHIRRRPVPPARIQRPTACR
ncbi:hypothetical protein [Parafrankia sp. FMc2]|uniref:hypothetical protein n=1 Tax=Parafrankia sp. FMc2 TaxID=3233196 RepID=UPI0034D46638